jgi:hypothetical protein
MRTMPQRVPPSARAASFSPGGAWAKTSRVTEATIGSTISDTTTPAMNIDCTNTLFSSRPPLTAKIGTKPRWRARNADRGASCSLSSSQPQMP